MQSGDDQKVGESAVVVLSHAYWTTRFGQRADVVNQQMVVNGQSMTIVGVAPRDFEGTTLGATVVGALIGVTAAVWVARGAERILFEMNGRDPVVFAGAAITLALVAFIAGFIPAHRASKVDPMTALRWE